MGDQEYDIWVVTWKWGPPTIMVISLEKNCKQWIFGTISWDNQILFCKTKLAAQTMKNELTIVGMLFNKNSTVWDLQWILEFNRPNMVMWIKENLEIWTNYVKSGSVDWVRDLGYMKPVCLPNQLIRWCWSKHGKFKYLLVIWHSHGASPFLIGKPV